MPQIEKLGPAHVIAGFDSESEPLDRFLARSALQGQRAGGSTTYVACDGVQVIGYYTLVVGHIAFDDAAERLRKGLSRHPVPVMILARLAVDVRHRGRRYGQGLLRDAMLRTLQAADIAGIRAFVVHAKDEAAAAFYRRFDFVAAPTDALHLFVLLKDVRAALAP